MIRRIIDLLSPRSCHVCGRRLAVSEEEICSACDWHLPRTGYIRTAYDNALARLFWGRFPIEKAISYYFHQPQSETSRIIYDLKYHSQPHLGTFLGRMIAVDAQRTETEMPQDMEEGETDNSGCRHGHHFFDGIDIIVPIPITWWRRWQRGYNQSEMIAKGIHEITGIPVCRDIVKRKRFSESQTRLKASERMGNVENAFELMRPEKVMGRHVLLVDDIITTGATITSCAKELQKAGNVKISVLSIGFTK